MCLSLISHDPNAPFPSLSLCFFCSIFPRLSLSRTLIFSGLISQLIALALDSGSPDGTIWPVVAVALSLCNTNHFVRPSHS